MRRHLDHAATRLRRSVFGCRCQLVAGRVRARPSAAGAGGARSVIETRHQRSAARILVANTSFIADCSSLNRPITLVRRRSSTNERSARLVVRTRMRCRTGTRFPSSSPLADPPRVPPSGTSAGHPRGVMQRRCRPARLRVEASFIRRNLCPRRSPGSSRSGPMTSEDNVTFDLAQPQTRFSRGLRELAFPDAHRHRTHRPPSGSFRDGS
jgi:hypothetical protein